MFRPMRPATVSPFAAPESLADFAALDNGQLALATLDNMAENRRRAALQWWAAPVPPSAGLVCCDVCGFPSLASVRGACECPEGADWVACPADTLADL